MVLTMTSFEQALSAPLHHFKRLRQLKPLCRDGKMVIRRTHSVIESEIVWDNRHYLLLLPFREECITHIEHLEYISHERSRGPLIENRILNEELMLFDLLGNRHYYDVILQEIPHGMMLDEAVHHYKSADLRTAICRMKSRLDAIGFRHNNLRPSNIVICKSGVARPLRYWYAEWEEFSDNDISQLLALIEQNALPELERFKRSLVAGADDKDTESHRHGDIIRYCRGGRYGFIDSDGRQVTPFIYSWASEFCEGRAIVAKCGKVGAIDYRGRKVVRSIYRTLEFDIETGMFVATNDKYRHLIDYNGVTISSKPLMPEEKAAVKVEDF